jgi:hypothetical protein
MSQAYNTEQTRKIINIPTKTVSFEELQGKIIVWRFLDEMGAMVKYYRMGKQNNKSAWLSACDENGEIYGMGHPGYEWERHSRSKIPRTVLDKKETSKMSQDKEEDKEEEEDGFEACESCGFFHHYEDKCPRGGACKHYEKVITY